MGQGRVVTEVPHRLAEVDIHRPRIHLRGGRKVEAKGFLWGSSLFNFRLECIFIMLQIFLENAEGPIPLCSYLEAMRVQIGPIDVVRPIYDV